MRMQRPKLRRRRRRKMQSTTESDPAYSWCSVSFSSGFLVRRTILTFSSHDCNIVFIGWNVYPVQPFCFVFHSGDSIVCMFSKNPKWQISQFFPHTTTRLRTRNVGIYYGHSVHVPHCYLLSISGTSCATAVTMCLTVCDPEHSSCYLT